MNIEIFLPSVNCVSSLPAAILGPQSTESWVWLTATMDRKQLLESATYPGLPGSAGLGLNFKGSGLDID